MAGRPRYPSPGAPRALLEGYTTADCVRHRLVFRLSPRGAADLRCAIAGRGYFGALAWTLHPTDAGGVAGSCFLSCPADRAALWQRRAEELRGRLALAEVSFCRFVLAGRAGVKLDLWDLRAQGPADGAPAPAVAGPLPAAQPVGPVLPERPAADDRD